MLFAVAVLLSESVLFDPEKTCLRATALALFALIVKLPALTVSGPPVAVSVILLLAVAT